MPTRPREQPTRPTQMGWRPPPPTHASPRHPWRRSKYPKAERVEFQAADLDAKGAKKLSRQKPLPPEEWALFDATKLEVMDLCVRSKFSRSAEARRLLLDTGSRELAGPALQFSLEFLGTRRHRLAST